MALSDRAKKIRDWAVELDGTAFAAYKASEAVDTIDKALQQVKDSEDAITAMPASLYPVWNQLNQDRTRMQNEQRRMEQNVSQQIRQIDQIGFSKEVDLRLQLASFMNFDQLQFETYEDFWLSDSWAVRQDRLQVRNTEAFNAAWWDATTRVNDRMVKWARHSLNTLEKQYVSTDTANRVSAVALTKQYTFNQFYKISEDYEKLVQARIQMKNFVSDSESRIKAVKKQVAFKAVHVKWLVPRLAMRFKASFRIGRIETALHEVRRILGKFISLRVHLISQIRRFNGFSERQSQPTVLDSEPEAADQDLPSRPQPERPEPDEQKPFPQPEPERFEPDEQKPFPQPEPERFEPHEQTSVFDLRTDPALPSVESSGPRRLLSFALTCFKASGRNVNPTISLAGVLPQPPQDSPEELQSSFAVLQSLTNTQAFRIATYRNEVAYELTIPTDLACERLTESTEKNDVMQSLRKLFVANCVNARTAFEWEHNSYFFVEKEAPRDGKCMFHSFAELILNAFEIGSWYDDNHRYEELVTLGKLSVDERCKELVKKSRQLATDYYGVPYNVTDPAGFGMHENLEFLCRYFGFTIVLTSREGNPVFSRRVLADGRKSLQNLIDGKDTTLEGRPVKLEMQKFGFQEDEVSEVLQRIKSYPQTIGYMICERAARDPVLPLFFDPFAENNEDASCWHFDYWRREAVQTVEQDRPTPDLFLLSSVAIAGDINFD